MQHAPQRTAFTCTAEIISALNSQSSRQRSSANSAPLGAIQRSSANSAPRSQVAPHAFRSAVSSGFGMAAISSSAAPRAFGSAMPMAAISSSGAPSGFRSAMAALATATASRGSAMAHSSSSAVPSGFRLPPPMPLPLPMAHSTSSTASRGVGMAVSSGFDDLISDAEAAEKAAVLAQVSCAELNPPNPSNPKKRKEPEQDSEPENIDTSLILTIARECDDAFCAVMDTIKKGGRQMKWLCKAFLEIKEFAADLLRQLSTVFAEVPKDLTERVAKLTNFLHIVTIARGEHSNDETTNLYNFKRLFPKNFNELLTEITQTIERNGSIDAAKKGPLVKFTNSACFRSFTKVYVEGRSMVTVERRMNAGLETLHTLVPQLDNLFANISSDPAILAEAKELYANFRNVRQTVDAIYTEYKKMEDQTIIPCPTQVQSPFDKLARFIGKIPTENMRVGASSSSGGEASIPPFTPVSLGDYSLMSNSFVSSSF